MYNTQFLSTFDYHISFECQTASHFMVILIESSREYDIDCFTVLLVRDVVSCKVVRSLRRNELYGSLDSSCSARTETI
jgi:hypothetical protein